ncbi:MAG: hypothetical protein IT332_03720 [Ardenticatenales bacterium]|nr:hypothetical protein [Ardenticatenales bacterium]
MHCLRGGPMVRAIRRAIRPAARGHIARALAVALCVALLPAVGGARPQVTLEDTLNLSLTAGRASSHPGIAIATDSATNTGTVHVVWEEENAEFIVNGVAHRYRNFNLQTGNWKGDWSAVHWIFESGQDPAIAARGDLVVVAFVQPPWEDGAPTEINVARWAPGTQTWSEPSRLRWGQKDNVTFYCKQPDVAIDALGRVWMTWVDEASDGQPYWAIVSAELPTLGELSSVDIILDTVHAQSPRIAAGPEAGDGVWSTWNKDVPELGEGEIIRSAFKPGNGWVESTKLNSGSHGRAPDLAAGSNGDACTAWQEQVDGGAGQPDIYMDCTMPGQRSVNLSGTAADRSVEPSVVFGPPDVGAMVAWREQPQAPDASINFKPAEPAAAPIAIEGGKVSSPVIAAHGGIVHAVWVKDEDQGSPDVYYGRFPSSIPTPTPEPTTPGPSATHQPPSPTATRTRATPSATNTPRRPSATPSIELTPTPGPTSTAIPTLETVRGIVILPYMVKPRPVP